MGAFLSGFGLFLVVLNLNFDVFFLFCFFLVFFLFCFLFRVWEIGFDWLFAGVLYI